MTNIYFKKSIIFYLILNFIVIFINQEIQAKEKKKNPIQKIYNKNYSKIYDELWAKDIKYKWEIQEIQKNINILPNKVHLLDSGCGTGIHLSYLPKSYNKTGLDISKNMIDIAKQKNPKGLFVNGNMNNKSLFDTASFTHIISMYDATFYNKELKTIFNNYHHWLKKDGILIFEVIDRDNIFENIGAKENSNYLKKTGKNVAFQKKAITQYKDFVTHTWWELFNKNYRAVYHEQIVYKNGKKEKKEHIMYLPPINLVENIVKDSGFTLIDKKRVINDKSELFYVYKKVIK